MYIRSGARAKIKIDGVKYRGIVSGVDMNTETIEVTLGGLAPGSPPPDTYRTFVPGRTKVTLTIELELP